MRECETNQIQVTPRLVEREIAPTMPNENQFEFDVFISYSSKDEEWVVNTLLPRVEQAGVKASIDFRDFKPGRSALFNMQDAVRHSRHTLLVLTENWFGSQWTLFESVLGATKDPAGLQQRTIPLLLRKCEVPENADFIAGLTYVDFTRADREDLAWRQLFTALGSQAEQLHVADIGDVLKWKWDGRKLLEKLIALDLETTNEDNQLTQAHEGTPDQWGPVFMENRETWRLLITEPGNIVGYWHIAPLFPREYELAKNGKLLDSQITADTVQLFWDAGRYDIYFVQVCMLPQYRRPRHIRLLFETFFKVLDDLSADEIFVREICANGFTEVGEVLCKMFHLEWKCKHSEHGEIYAGQISTVLERSLARRFPDLQKRYAKEGLIEGLD